MRERDTTRSYVVSGLRLRLRLVDRYWHWRYWRVARTHGTACEHVTDLAERCIDARLAVLSGKHTGSGT